MMDNVSVAVAVRNDGSTMGRDALINMVKAAEALFVVALGPRDEKGLTELHIIDAGPRSGVTPEIIKGFCDDLDEQFIGTFVPSTKEWRADSFREIRVVDEGCVDTYGGISCCVGAGAKIIAIFAGSDGPVGMSLDATDEYTVRSLSAYASDFKLGELIGIFVTTL